MPTEVFKEAAPSSVEQDGRDVVCRFSAGDDAAGALYMAFDGPEAHCDEVLVDGVSLGDYDKSAWGAFDDVFYLGRQGAIKEVVLRGCSAPADAFTARFCYVDMDVLASSARTAWDRAIQTREVRDGYVRAFYSAPEAGQVLLTIPYEEGWRVTVNGRRVQTGQGADIFMLIPVQAGENEIVLEYAAKGRAAGAALSVLSLALFTAWGVYSRKNMCRRNGNELL